MGLFSKKEYRKVDAPSVQQGQPVQTQPSSVIVSPGLPSLETQEVEEDKTTEILVEFLENIQKVVEYTKYKLVNG